MNKLFLTLKFALLFLVLLLLSSCATTASFQPVHPKASQHWRAQGKISMREDAKAETASLDWQQNAQQYRIRIFGPLGLGAVELNGNPQGVELIDSRGQLHQAASAEMLSKQILGYSLPVQDLVYWLKGVKTKHYYGWTVQYLSYHQDGMPKLMTASRSHIYLRIFIDKWQFF